MAQCQVCGKPSGYFPLCRDCNGLKEQGVIVKCDDCGRWHNSSEGCSSVLPGIVQKKTSKPPTQIEKPCPICGRLTSSKFICNDCEVQKNDLMQQLPNYESYEDAKVHYMNLKNTAKYSLRKMSYVEVAAIRLCAISEFSKIKFHNTEIQDRIEEEITKLIVDKRNYLESKTPNQANVKDTTVSDEKFSVDQEVSDYRRTFPPEIRCTDGHYVRSKSEFMIDDYLYRSGISHEYERRVYDPETKETYFIDFYLPGFSGDVYIEHAGLDNKDYIEKINKKVAYFNRHGLQYIITIEKEMMYIGDYLGTKLADISYKNTKK